MLFCYNISPQKRKQPDFDDEVDSEGSLSTSIVSI